MSFASIISIIVVLAAYGYSVPLEGKWQTATVPASRWEFTTGKTIVDNKDTITAHLMNSEEAANAPETKIPQEFIERFAWSTPATSEARDSRESPMVFEKLMVTSPFTPTIRTPTSDLFPRLFVEPKVLDSSTWRPSNSAEEKVMPKRAFAGKANVMDKSTSAEVFATTPVWRGASKEATSAERVWTGETATKMSSGWTRPVKTTSGEVDRSSEESKVTPRVPIKGTRPVGI